MIGPILVTFHIAWSAPKPAGQILIRQSDKKQGSIVLAELMVAQLAKKFSAVINRFIIQSCTLINIHKIFYE